jgi:hypothetical protein
MVKEPKICYIHIGELYQTYLYTDTFETKGQFITYRDLYIVGVYVFETKVPLFCISDLVK